MAILSVEPDYNIVESVTSNVPWVATENGVASDLDYSLGRPYGDFYAETVNPVSSLELRVFLNGDPDFSFASQNLATNRNPRVGVAALLGCGIIGSGRFGEFSVQESTFERWRFNPEDQQQHLIVPTFYTKNGVHPNGVLNTIGAEYIFRLNIIGAPSKVFFRKLWLAPAIYVAGTLEVGVEDTSDVSRGEVGEFVRLRDRLRSISGAVKASNGYAFGNDLKDAEPRFDSTTGPSQPASPRRLRHNLARYFQVAGNSGEVVYIPTDDYRHEPPDTATQQLYTLNDSEMRRFPVFGRLQGDLKITRSPTGGAARIAVKGLV